MFKKSLTKFFLLFFLLSLFSQGYSLTYQQIATDPWTLIHILVVDPTKEVIVPVKAAQSRETVATLAKRHRAAAAINGGFWRANGDPAGILKINGKWYGTPVKPRGAIGWSEQGRRVLVDRVLTNVSLNKDTDPNTIEVIPATYPVRTTSEEWKEVEHIVGGAPLLISKGIKVTNYLPEQTLVSFLGNKHPRTAVGIRANGEWVFVVVDGRGLSIGMTIPELTEVMYHLHCVDAVNLDGGNSSTMVIDGIVINQPCGKLNEEGKKVEAVSDAILILPQD